MKYLSDNYLYHYGILGMKWGIRRTPEQLGSSKRTLSSEEKRKQKIDAALKKKIDVRDMPTEDLQKVLDRLTLEKRYNDMMNELHPKRKSYTLELLRRFAQTSVNSAVKSIAKKQGNRLANSIWNTPQQKKKNDEDDDD